MSPMNEQWLPPQDSAGLASALLAGDPLHGSPALREYFGHRYDAVVSFVELLVVEGERRGLLGPREYDRIWERHILNSAAVAQHVPAGSVVDIGSGAGLPGMVLAAMDPRRAVTLVEPMERRAVWLNDAVTALGWPNVTVVRARAEEIGEEFDAVTARAVAAIDKLVKWCGPLMKEGGAMVFLKGRSASEEVERARFALRKARLVAEIRSAPTIAGLEPTTVVRLTRSASTGP